MALVSIDTTEKLQRQQKAIYWKVTDKSKKLTINRNDENINIDDSATLLKETLKDCIGDYVNVTLYTEKPTQLEKGSIKGKIFELLVQLETANNNNNNYKQVSGIGAPNFNDVLNLHKQVMELEFEKKMSQANEDKIRVKPMDKLIEKLTEGNTINLLLSAFMAKATKQPEAIGSLPNDMKQTFDKFANVDPDYKNTLAKMADYLETNPGVLQQIKLIIGA
jgi:hypothetical protein